MRREGYMDHIQGIDPQISKGDFSGHFLFLLGIFRLLMVFKTADFENLFNSDVN